MKKISATSTETAKPWVLLQQTAKGPRYYTGKGHPITPESWTPSISRAGRMAWDAVVNMQAWVAAHTGGESIERVRF